MAGEGATGEGAILEAVYAAIDQLNQILPPEDRLVKDPATKLYGPEGPLDSMGLVNLIVLTEEAVEERTGREVNLGAEALSESHNPFADLRSLVQHLLDRS